MCCSYFVPSRIYYPYDFAFNTSIRRLTVLNFELSRIYYRCNFAFSTSIRWLTVYYLFDFSSLRLHILGDGEGEHLVKVRKKLHRGLTAAHWYAVISCILAFPTSAQRWPRMRRRMVRRTMGPSPS
jgi:hypothetical protein